MALSRWTSLAVAAMAMVLSARGLPADGVEPASAAKPIVVEYVTGKPVRSDTLGTTSYEPSEMEGPFFKRLAGPGTFQRVAR